MVSRATGSGTESGVNLFDEHIDRRQSILPVLSWIIVYVPKIVTGSITAMFSHPELVLRSAARGYVAGGGQFFYIFIYTNH